MTRISPEHYGAQRRLIVYGSLVPGGSNHQRVAHLAGTWNRGWVTGTLVWTGWGAEVGYPALSWDPAGPRVAAQLLESDLLADHWPRLDEFEGEDYRRILIPFFREDGSWVVGQIYVGVS